MAWYDHPHPLKDASCQVPLPAHSPEANHCAFDLWAPDRHTSINNLAFSAYSFHQQQIEDFIDCLAASYNPNDLEEQRKASFNSGLNLDDCTDDEIHYIEREVSKRCR